jgi:hypothetical protein
MHPLEKSGLICPSKSQILKPGSKAMGPVVEM